MAKPEYFLSPRFKRNTLSNSSLWENNPAELKYNLFNLNNFSTEDINSIYNMTENFIPYFVYKEEISYRSPQHKDEYMPIMHKYNTNNYAVGINVAPIIYKYYYSYTQQEYGDSTYELLLPFNQSQSSNSYLDIGWTIPYFLKGFILNIEIFLESKLNKYLFSIPKSHYGNYERLVFYYINDKIYVSITPEVRSLSYSSPTIYLNSISK